LAVGDDRKQPPVTENIAIENEEEERYGLGYERRRKIAGDSHLDISFPYFFSCFLCLLGKDIT